MTSFICVNLDVYDMNIKIIHCTFSSYYITCQYLSISAINDGQLHFLWYHVTYNSYLWEEKKEKDILEEDYQNSLAFHEDLIVQL